MQSIRLGKSCGAPRSKAMMTGAAFWISATVLSLGASLIEPAKLLEMPLPAELDALDTQFIALQVERAARPYDAALDKLNSSYINSLEAKLREEKAAASLDGVLALQAELKLLAANQPVPETDSADVPSSLKGLREIYRGTLANLEATFSTTVNELAAALAKRLERVEADFVKTDRIPDAKLVRAYREVLKKQGAGGENVAGALKTPAQGQASAGSDVRTGYTNSLGMKFIAVRGTDVLFCIHETRYRDYKAFAADSSVSPAWKNQAFDNYTPADRPEDHPVVNVSWQDAKAFCNWLSAKEGKTYRLPTDREWSIAAGIGRFEQWDEGTTPATVSKDHGTYPWDGGWPPPRRAGNYSDESRKEKAPHAGDEYIERYDDGFPTTAPVMSFNPNKADLYDLSGNVLEWCEDWYDSSKKYRVLRGASWGRSDSNSLLSAFRRRMPEDSRCEFDGFRIVLVPNQ